MFKEGNYVVCVDNKKVSGSLQPLTLHKVYVVGSKTVNPEKVRVVDDDGIGSVYWARRFRPIKERVVVGSD